MKYIFYALLIATLTSCSSKKYERIPYFKDIPKDSIYSESLKTPPLLLIQRGDAFNIDVSSANSMASALFSNAKEGTSSGESGATSSKSYIVDNEGNIRIPLAGSVKLEGLNLIQAREKIEKELQTFLKEPVVNLKLANFRVSVMGDVASPGAYLVDKENVSVIEVLSMAGDLNITAQRENVLLLREEGGRRTYVRLDLQSKKMFDSPYFYLKSGDVLYVQPGSAKYASIDNKYQILGVVVSLVSILTVVYAQFIR